MRKEKRLGFALEDGKWREIRQGEVQGEGIKEATHISDYVRFLSVGFSSVCT